MGKVSAPQTLFKKETETRHFSMDFANLMATGETIEASSPAPVVTSERLGGGSSDLTITSVAISGQTITFTIADGTNGNRYRVYVVITTSADQVLDGDGVLVVRN